jgi:hypothetical protein
MASRHQFCAINQNNRMVAIIFELELPNHEYKKLDCFIFKFTRPQVVFEKSVEEDIA